MHFLCHLYVGPTITASPTTTSARCDWDTINTVWRGGCIVAQSQRALMMVGLAMIVGRQTNDTENASKSFIFYVTPVYSWPPMTVKEFTVMGGHIFGWVES